MEHIAWTSDQIANEALIGMIHRTVAILQDKD